MTAHSNLQDAIAAIKDGAYDYVEKPVQPERLAKIVQKAIETQEMKNFSKEQLNFLKKEWKVEKAARLDVLL